MFNRREHLVEHMKISYHSLHQPRCGVCLKHCKSFESVREHLNGMFVFVFVFHHTSYEYGGCWCLFDSVFPTISVPDHLSKGNCKAIFTKRGCTLCLQIFEEAFALAEHKNKCHLSPPRPLVSFVGNYLDNVDYICSAASNIPESILSDYWNISSFPLKWSD